MNFFIHIVTDFERLVDHEGYSFASGSEARQEAEMAARQILADELLAGRPLPLSWRAEVTNKNGRILYSFTFASLIRDAADPYPQKQSVGSKRVLRELEAATLTGAGERNTVTRKTR